MTDEQKRQAPPTHGTAAVAESRERRLAAALRANLARRKAQARERAQQPSVVPKEPDGED